MHITVTRQLGGWQGRRGSDSQVAAASVAAIPLLKAPSRQTPEQTHPDRLHLKSPRITQQHLMLRSSVVPIPLAYSHVHSRSSGDT